jgi:hypothetical protein
MKSFLTPVKVLTAMTAAAALSAALPFAANAQSNTGHVVFGTSDDKPAASNTLQKLLEDETTGTPIDTVNDETGAELFQSIVGNDVASTLLIEVAGFKNNNKVGIYDPVTNKKVYLFSGGDAPPQSRSIAYNDLFHPTNFGPAFEGKFGFFLEGPGGVFYSQFSKNVDGKDYFLAYEMGEDTTIGGVTGGQNTYVFAFEDKRVNSDMDYNDFVATVSGVTDVPEPATMLGLAAFAGGALALRRRQQSA